MTLPSGWRSLPLGDLGKEVRSNVTPLAGTRYVHYSVPSFNDGRPAVEDGDAIKSAKRQLQPGDILISRINPRINRVWLVGDHHGEQIIGSSEWVVLRLHDEATVLRPYLLWYLRSPEFRQRIAGTVSGVTGSHTRAKPKDILRYPVPVAPPDEQRAIVDQLDQYMRRIDEALSRLDDGRRRLALLQHTVDTFAVYGRLHAVRGNRRDAVRAVEGCRRRDGSTTRLAPSPPDQLEVPETWVWSSLDELADVQSGAAKSRKLEGVDGCVERPYLSVANVQRGRLDLAEVATMWVRASKLESLTLQVGDVLFNEGGDKDKLGRGWVWEGQIADCVHQNHVFRARLRGDGVDPRWLSHWGNVFGRWWFHERASQTTGIASINKSVLRSLPVPVPPPFEQQAIIEKMTLRSTAISHASATIQQAQRRAAVLRRAALKAAFSGRLLPQTAAARSESQLEEAIA